MDNLVEQTQEFRIETNLIYCSFTEMKVIYLEQPAKYASAYLSVWLDEKLI